MDVRIRRGRPDDLAPVLDLVAGYCAADGHQFDADVARAGVVPLLAHDRVGVILVAEVDGALDGYAAVTWGWSIEIGGSEAVLDEVYVRRRTLGIGGRLVEAIEAECRRRCVRRIFLETESPNAAARRLYVRHGFVTEDSIWMAKEL